MLDMVGFMFFDFGGLSILDQRSFLNNRVGTQIFGPKLMSGMTRTSVQAGAQFDGEGIPDGAVQLVENGVVKRLVYARATAAKDEAIRVRGQSRACGGHRAMVFLSLTKWERRR